MDCMMKTKDSIWLVVVLMAAAIALAGCDKEQADQDEVAEEVQEEAHPEYHSPFYLIGEGELMFDSISFTDVGLKPRERTPADLLILEAIAESLAYELKSHEELDFSASVKHDKSLLDPSNHLRCDKDHLYVALWRGYEPDRWGYSLWSGCHERQKFEWQEVPDPHDDDVDAVTWVEPLTESIVDSIHEAQIEDCYSARC